MIYNSEYTLVYDNTYALLRDQVAETEMIHELCESTLSPGEQILDLGCGTGSHLSLLNGLLKGRFKLSGIDGSEFMIKVSRQRLGAEINLYHSRLDSMWPINSSSVGLIYGTFNIFQSFVDKKDREQFLSETSRVLRSSGIAVFDCHCEPNFGYKYPPGLVSEFNRNGVSIRVSSAWMHDSNVKKTFVSFFDQAKGSLIHEGQHEMLRTSWPEIVTDCCNFGLCVKEKFADWKKTPFDPDDSPVVVIILEKK